MQFKTSLKTRKSKPWEIMVDSRATTARPLDKASDTCGDILSRLLSCFKSSCKKKQIKIGNQKGWIFYTDTLLFASRGER